MNKIILYLIFGISTTLIAQSHQESALPKELGDKIDQFIDIQNSTEIWRIAFLVYPNISAQKALNRYWEYNLWKSPIPDANRLSPLSKNESAVTNPYVISSIDKVNDSIWIIGYVPKLWKHNDISGAVFHLKKNQWFLIEYSMPYWQALQSVNSLTE